MAKLKLTAPIRTGARKRKVLPEASPAEAAIAPVAKPPTKIQSLTALLRRPDGARIDELMAATGWQAHSVRGALSGALKKKLHLNVISEKAEGGRVYRIAAEVAA